MVIFTTSHSIPNYQTYKLFLAVAAAKREQNCWRIKSNQTTKKSQHLLIMTIVCVCVQCNIYYTSIVSSSPHNYHHQCDGCRYNTQSTHVTIPLFARKTAKKMHGPAQHIQVDKSVFQVNEGAKKNVRRNKV